LGRRNEDNLPSQVQMGRETNIIFLPKFNLGRRRKDNYFPNSKEKECKNNLKIILFLLIWNILKNKFYFYANIKKNIFNKKKLNHLVLNSILKILRISLKKLLHLTAESLLCKVMLLKLLKKPLCRVISLMKFLERF
jgi:hypothetical protein